MFRGSQLARVANAKNVKGSSLCPFVLRRLQHTPSGRFVKVTQSRVNDWKWNPFLRGPGPRLFQISRPGPRVSKVQWPTVRRKGSREFVNSECSSISDCFWYIVRIMRISSLSTKRHVYRRSDHLHPLYRVTLFIHSTFVWTLEFDYINMIYDVTWFNVFLMICSSISIFLEYCLHLLKPCISWSVSLLYPFLYRTMLFIYYTLFTPLILSK